MSCPSISASVLGFSSEEGVTSTRKSSGSCSDRKYQAYILSTRVTNAPNLASIAHAPVEVISS